MKKIINTNDAPAAIGPYSQAIITQDFLFTSGQLGIDPSTGELEGSFDAQVRRAIENAGAILKAAGLSYENVVKTTCFLADMKNFAAFNSIYAEYFKHNPARSCVEVSALPKGALVEIELIASREK